MHESREISDPAMSKLLELGLPEDAHTPWPPSLEAVQASFPELRAIALLGQGATGAVFHTVHRQSGQHGALKILSPELMRRPELVTRFSREAEALQRLTHGSIATVLEFGERDGLFFIEMEHVAAENLRMALEPPVPASVAIPIAVQLCEALEYAHELGIVHRDIKPENILLAPDGTVTLVDFGLAKLRHADTPWTLTGTSSVLGTPLYLAPEQIETPTLVDRRADVYSVGVVLYELLTGKLPIGRFAEPSKIAALDRRLDRVVVRALMPDRDKRYATAAKMRAALVGTTQRSWRGLAGHVRRPAALAGLAASLALGAGALALWPDADEARADTSAEPRTEVLAAVTGTGASKDALLRFVPASADALVRVHPSALADLPALSPKRPGPTPEAMSKPEPLTSLMLAARAAEGEQRWDDAKLLYARVLDRDADHATARYRLGRTLYELGEHKASAQLLYDYLQRHPEDVDVGPGLYYAGLSLTKVGLCRDALAYFRKIAEVRRVPRHVREAAAQQADTLRGHLDGSVPRPKLQCTDRLDSTPNGTMSND